MLITTIKEASWQRSKVPFPRHSLQLFDGGTVLFGGDIKQFFSNCVAINITDFAWKQGTYFGGFGLQFLSQHSCDVYISLLNSLDLSDKPTLAQIS